MNPRVTETTLERNLREDIGYQKDSYFHHEHTRYRRSFDFVIPEDIDVPLTTKKEFSNYSCPLRFFVTMAKVNNSKAVKLAAKSYSAKLGADIRVFDYFYKIRNNVDMPNVRDFWECVLKDLNVEQNKKTGYLLTIVGGHYVPIIHEQQGEQHSLVIMDSIGGCTSMLNGLEKVAIDTNSLSKLKQFKLYSNRGYRQADSSSCRIDALLIIRDALSIPGSFVELLSSIKKAKKSLLKLDYRICFLPTFCYKAAQTQRGINKLIEKKVIDPDALVAPGLTFSQYREAHTLTIFHNGPLIAIWYALAGALPGQEATSLVSIWLLIKSYSPNLYDTAKINVAYLREEKEVADVVVPNQYVVEYDQDVSTCLSESKFSDETIKIVKSYLNIPAHLRDVKLLKHNEDVSIKEDSAGCYRKSL